MFKVDRGHIEWLNASIIAGPCGQAASNQNVQMLGLKKGGKPGLYLVTLRFRRLRCFITRVFISVNGAIMLGPCIIRSCHVSPHVRRSSIPIKVRCVPISIRQVFASLNEDNSVLDGQHTLGSRLILTLIQRVLRE